jgi:hypothetical protein
MIIASRLVCRTSTGEVFSVKKNGTKKKLKTYISNNYEEVSLSWKGYKQNVKVHQKKNCIDHIDGDRLNNSITNLRLVDYKENAKGRKKKRRLMKSEVQRIVDMKKDGFSFKQIGKVFDINENSARRIFNKIEKK